MWKQGCHLHAVLKAQPRAPTPASQIETSLDIAKTILMPLGENVTYLKNISCCSQDLWTSLPDFASQTLRVIEPDTICQPSPENATDMTLEVPLVRGPMRMSPVCTSHIQIVLSPEPEVICLLSGEKLIQKAAMVCHGSLHRVQAFMLNLCSDTQTLVWAEIH